MKITVVLAAILLIILTGNLFGQASPVRPTPTPSPSPQTFDEVYGLKDTDLKDLKVSPNIFGDDLASRTKAAINKKDYDAVLAEINDRIAKNKKDAEALVLRGDVYLAQSKTELARADYTQAIKINPKNAQYYYKRGMSYQEAPGYNLQTATADNDKALELDPNNSGALTEKGYNFNREKKIPEAKAAFEAAVKSDPSNGRAYYQLGAIAVSENNSQAALDAFTRSIAADPTYMYSYGSRAEVYASLKDYDKALADWAKIIELYPKVEYGYGNRSTLYLTMGNYRRAIEDLTQILTFTDSPDPRLRTRAVIYEVWGKYDEARADYDKYFGKSGDTFTKNEYDKNTYQTYVALIAKIAKVRENQGKLSIVYNKALDAYTPIEDELAKRMDAYLAIKKTAKTPVGGKNPACDHIPYLTSLTEKALLAFNPIEVMYVAGELKGFSEQLDFADDRSVKLKNTKTMLQRDKQAFACTIEPIFFVE